jgi:hypothetical protein
MRFKDCYIIIQCINVNTRRIEIRCCLFGDASKHNRLRGFDNIQLRDYKINYRNMIHDLLHQSTENFSTCWVPI